METKHTVHFCLYKMKKNKASCPKQRLRENQDLVQNVEVPSTSLVFLPTQGEEIVIPKNC